MGMNMPPVTYPNGEVSGSLAVGQRAALRDADNKHRPSPTPDRGVATGA